MSHLVLYAPALAGFIVLFVGIALQRKQRTQSAFVDRWHALAAVLVAAPLGAFGVEHFVTPAIIASIVPSWFPAHLAVTYFVGVALVAAAISFITGRLIQLSSLLVGVMFLLFVVLMHIPATLQDVHDRQAWLIVARDSTFSAAGFALFASLTDRPISQLIARITQAWAGLAIAFFGVQQILHPECSPGVPSERITPHWVPAPIPLGYLAGVLLVLCGCAMVLRIRAKDAANIAAGLMIFFTVFLYLPDGIMEVFSGPSLVGTNYVFDTLLYGGALLVIANAMEAPVSAPIRVLERAS